MEIKFVPFNDTYLCASWEWLQNSELRSLIDAPLITREQQIEWFNNLPYREDYFIWGVEGDGIPVGVCGLKNVHDGEGEFWGYIGEQELRGKGIGKNMTKHIEDFAQSRGLKKIVLHVLKSNVQAVGFYKRVHYNIENETENRLMMSKMLNESTYAY